MSQCKIPIYVWQPKYYNVCTFLESRNVCAICLYSFNRVLEHVDVYTYRLDAICCVGT